MMQNNQLTDYESRLIGTRVCELSDQLYNIRKKFQYLSLKYVLERKSLNNLSSKLETLSQKMNVSCTNMLAITLNSSDRSDAVIVAILENMFAEKRIVHVLFSQIFATYAYADNSFSIFQQFLSKIFRDDRSPETLNAAVHALTDVHNHMETIHKLVSKFYEKSFQFICTFEETLAKIKIVLRKLSVCDDMFSDLPKLSTS